MIQYFVCFLSLSCSKTRLKVSTDTKHLANGEIIELPLKLT